MEIGAQIKQFRQRRGITQEALAQHLGITAQAVSKWERGVATPDIGLLPELSAYLGVTIDSLFAISDDIRMERIQNMLWDVRFLSETDIETSKEFLLEKAQKEPKNGIPHAMLAEMENHIAQCHMDTAAEYAKEALRRDYTLKEAHSEFTQACAKTCGDWCASNHYALIEYYKEFILNHPDFVPGYLWLMDPLIADGRIEEAEYYCNTMAQYDNTYRTLLYKGKIELAKGNKEKSVSILKEMETKFSDSWIMYLGAGDLMVKMGEYDGAKAYFRKYLEHQTPPRYTDSLTSIAQLCEIQGDYEGAILAIKEEISLLSSDWNTTAGETVDQHYRNIARLESKIEK